MIALELLPKKKTISCSFNVSSDAYYDCAQKISCEDRIAVEASINLDSGIHIHNTIHKSYAVECTYLPGFLNMRQPPADCNIVVICCHSCFWSVELKIISCGLSTKGCVCPWNYWLISSKALWVVSGNEQESRTHITLASCTGHTLVKMPRHQKWLLRSFCSTARWDSPLYCTDFMGSLMMNIAIVSTVYNLWWKWSLDGIGVWGILQYRYRYNRWNSMWTAFVHSN